MKNLLLFYSFLLTISCNVSEDLEQNGSIVSNLDYIVNAVESINEDAHVSSVTESPSDYSDCMKKFRDNANVVEEFSVLIDSNSGEGQVKIAAITKMVDNEIDNYEVLYHVKTENGYDNHVVIRLHKTQDLTFQVISIDSELCSLNTAQNGEVELRWCGFGCWLDCIGNVADLREVKILAVLGGVGCAACGLAAGFIVGAGAIACAG